MESNHLGYLVKRVQQALRNAIDPALSGRGLTTAQYATLYNLQRHPGASNAELARHFFVTPQTMVRMVIDLKRKGMLTRWPPPSHAGVLEARLTEDGASALQSAQDLVDEVHVRMLAGRSPAEIEQLAAWLTEMASGLEGR
jgi:DNA-binding MarR family transcriptional regulator